MLLMLAGAYTVSVLSSCNICSNVLHPRLTAFSKRERIRLVVFPALFSFRPHPAAQ